MTFCKAWSIFQLCTRTIDRERFGALLSQPVDSPVQAPFVHHVVVRKDLTPGQQMAQCLHAAGESAQPRPLPGTIAVALHARDQAHLIEIGERLDQAGIACDRVIEDDGQLMAIGIRPTIDRAAVRKVLSSLPLVK